MPKYTYKCTTCDLKEQYYCISTVKTAPCPMCEGLMKRQMPKTTSPEIKETIDKYTNTQHKNDHGKIMEARKMEYYWTVEVPRFVASGTYSMETMVENGWVYFDDKKHMHVQDKPPYRR